MADLYPTSISANWKKAGRKGHAVGKEGGPWIQNPRSSDLELLDLDVDPGGR